MNKVVFELATTRLLVDLALVVCLSVSVDTFAAASGGSSIRGALDALLDSLSSEAHFFLAALDSGPLIYSV